MSGRLPGLTQGKPGGKPASGSALKFKPKAVARKSKEERDANVLKVEEPKKQPERKKYTQKPPGGQRRQPKYLNNTRVITSGPLAAGNFSGGSSRGNGFIKTEGSQSSLLQQGLKSVSDDEANASDGEDSSAGKRINMGKEYSEADFKKETDNLFEGDEDDVAANMPIDEETRTSKQLANLFPVRAVRINHEKVDSMQKAVQESMSTLNTRDPTPGPVKLEHDQNQDLDGTLSDVVKEREDQLKEKLRVLNLQQEINSVDAEEVLKEVNLLFEDHKHIYKKLNRINDVPNKFLFIQFPSNFPEFKRPLTKTQDTVVENKEEETSKASDEDSKDGKQPKTKKNAPESPQPLVGNVGSIRVHKSGKLSVKIGNVVMDISRGAESTFLQDVVSLDLEGQEAELLGQIDGRAVVTPHI